MSNISGQLIKDSFNYVLQSDLITGVVYRIGGSVAENPKFISGLTVNANFTYSDGSEFPGYVLTCDAAGNAVWSPVSGATSGVVVTGGTFDYSAGTLTLVLSNGVNVPISGLQDIYVTGGTVSGTSIVFSYNDTDTFAVTGITPYSLFSSYTASTQVTINNKLDISGFTAYTATTQPLILNSVTGGTYSGGTLFLINNSGTTIPITGFTTGGTSTTDSYVTGFSYNNYQITLTQNRSDNYSSFTITLSGLVQNDIFSSYTASTQSTINNKLDTSGFTAYTATTQPLILNSVTGGTYSGGTLYLVNNSGNTVQITGFSTSSSGGSSNLQYYISGSTPTGIINSGDRWFNTQTGIELVYINDGDSQQWVQPYSVPGPAGQDLGVYSTTGITSSQTITWDKTYWGISGSTNVNLSLPTTVGKDGYYLIIKDESGICGNYRIRLTPSVGLIDGNNYVDMNINYMSLTCLVRGGNWYLI
jgi:hypothetical protein